MKKLLIAISFSNSIVMASPLLQIQEGSPPDGLCQTTKELTFKEGRNINNTLWQKGEDKHIADSTSKISIWESRSNLLQGCRKPSDWIKASDIVPGDGTRVVTFFAKNCSFDNSIEDRNDAVYILFEEKLGKISKTGDKTVTRYFYSYDGWFETPAVRNKKIYNNYYVTDYSFHSFTKKCLILKN